jgi:hypothetical protein
MSLQLSGDGVVTGLDSLASSDLGAQLGSKLNIAGGKILQIVRATDATTRNSTSTSFADAGISVTITPQKSDSAIILLHIARGSTANPANLVTVITDSSDNAISGAEAMQLGTGSTGINASHIIIGRATPATTSAVTYKVRFRSDAAGTTVQLANAQNTGQLYAIEVSA